VSGACDASIASLCLVPFEGTDETPWLGSEPVCLAHDAQRLLAVTHVFIQSFAGQQVAFVSACVRVGATGVDRALELVASCIGRVWCCAVLLGVVECKSVLIGSQQPFLHWGIRGPFSGFVLILTGRPLSRPSPSLPWEGG
jgi:hypothetical protein